MNGGNDCSDLQEPGLASVVFRTNGEVNPNISTAHCLSRLLTRCDALTIFE